MTETPREKAHRLLDEWIDGKLQDLMPGIENSQAVINLGFSFSRALLAAKKYEGDKL